MYACNELFKRYPNVKRKYEGETVLLTSIEQLFYQLSMFFSQPDTFTFDLASLYKVANEEEILFALKTIGIFFQKDARLINEKAFHLFDQAKLKEEDFFNQAMFARYLTEHGVKTNPSKIAVYKKRGKLPPADFFIQATPYWFRSTVQSYLEREHGINPIK